MKIGRNAPCPCGSGKKYKKCCLAQDEQDRQAAVAVVTPEPRPEAPTRSEASPASHSASLPPPDPHLEAQEARWEAFEAQDYEGQMALFTQTLDEAELLDNEMAFDMLDTLYPEAMEHDEGDRFDRLVETLHERLPEIYAGRAQHYLRWRITHALATGRVDTLPPLVRDVAATIGRDRDTFHDVLDQLAYHGHLALLVEATRLAWPRLRDSDEIGLRGIEDFGFQAMHLVLLHHGEQHAIPDPEAPSLVEQLEYYHPHDPEAVSRFLAHLSGQATRSWTLEDFALARRPRQPRSVFGPREAEWRPPTDPAHQNLFDLSVVFVGYVYREEAVPLSKGDLARRQLVAYLVERFNGELEARTQPSRRDKKRRPKAKRHEPSHVLCPDPVTLNRFLGPMTDLFYLQGHKVAATLELLPAWLRFLESRGLMDAARHSETLQGMRSLTPSVRKLCDQHPEDPSLQHALQTWWEQMESSTVT